GIVCGAVGDDGSIVYDCSSTITRAEAAVLLYRLFDFGVQPALPVFSAEEEAILPAWSVGAYSTVCAAGILSSDNPADTITRALCAEMLSAAIDLPE
ncbi:MAG: hypothetical protein IKZ09_10970, partial [Clostridia bacterium]|nr:hypothetical protein [Clostridia bacterium]